MNRYPIWKYLVIAAVLLWAALYTAPNFFGEAPAIQISSAKVTLKMSEERVQEVTDLLKTEKVPVDSIDLDSNSIKLRFASVDAQTQASDALKKKLNPEAGNESYTISRNLLPRTPQWLRSIYALPMYLGLDLRGGIHLMMQVDVQAALTKKSEALVGDMRRTLREKELRTTGISREKDLLTIRLPDESMLEPARAALTTAYPDLSIQTLGTSALSAQFKPDSITRIQDQAIEQNISTLHNRVNELGVAEPVIQKQGIDRIVVQLAGVQDMARVQQIIGRIATLETRLVDDSVEATMSLRDDTGAPFGTERFIERDGEPIILKKEVVFTGENLTDADATQDENGNPAVSVNLDSEGAARFKNTTGDNIGKRMAILLIEKGKGEVITAPVIQARLSNSFIITGRMSFAEASDTALLLRAGALAAPMEIIEERTIGPSLGVKNIAAGFNSVKYGFIAVAVFMCAYYAMFGVFSSLALGFNLLMLVAALSMMQATLTLPGMAAMALVLGMAIDANVLINERVREELRNGLSPQKAIHAGYDRAWATILDSNITTLIAGLALLAFGSGAVRGFAVVHCLGILTSMFSAVFFSRALVNLWYGARRKLDSVSIGTVWRTQNAAVSQNDANK